MYLNPKIYKIYSVIVLAASVLSAIIGIFNIVSISSFINRLIPAASQFTALIIVLFTVLSLLSLFFSYVEFSSMYAFGDMITYVQSDRINPMAKKPFIAPPSFYRSFGTAIFVIYFIAGMISALIMTTADSIKTHYFIALPLFPLILITLSIFLSYVTYYIKYKAIGDLLELSTTGEATSALKERIAENKPRMLRGYCTFLFVLSIIFLIVSAIALIFVFEPLASVFGTGFAVGCTIGFIFFAIIIFLEMAVTGCYFDNLGKMIEHYLIKYKLI